MKKIYTQTCPDLFSLKYIEWNMRRNVFFLLQFCHFAFTSTNFHWGYGTEHTFRHQLTVVYTMEIYEVCLFHLTIVTRIFGYRKYIRTHSYRTYTKSCWLFDQTNDRPTNRPTDHIHFHFQLFIDIQVTQIYWWPFMGWLLEKAVYIYIIFFNIDGHKHRFISIEWFTSLKMNGCSVPGKRIFSRLSLQLYFRRKKRQKQLLKIAKIGIGQPNKNQNNNSIHCENKTKTKEKQKQNSWHLFFF